MRRRLSAAIIAAALALLVLVPSGAADTPERSVTAQVLVTPLSAELLLPDRSFLAGRPIVVRARVTNDGTSTIEGAVVTLHLSEARIVVRDGTAREVGDLPPGRQVLARWEVCVPQPGFYLVLARVEASLDGIGVDAVTPARQLGVGAPPGRAPQGCPAV